MTSQILAIFYLNDLDHYIKEELKIKYYIRYQDDFVLMHPSKEYLKNCLNLIEKYVEKEKLKLNHKTRIYTNTNNFIFLGRDKFGNYAKYRTQRRKLKKRIYLYKEKKINLIDLVSSIQNFKQSRKKIKSF